jgi:amino acid adenylation domain-containing protein
VNLLTSEILVMHSVFRNATTRPDYPALIAGDNIITYQSLAEKTNQIAGYLRSRGVKPEDKVGIQMDRSPAFVLAALGILKSGAGYVALDPSYPPSRREFIIRDAGLSLVLTTSASATVETVDIDAPEISARDATQYDPVTDEDGLAYVVYTSGSSGTPKGVEITHRSLQNLVTWHNLTFSIGRTDRACLLANVGFDASVWEIWPYLCAGATLLVPASEIVREPEALRDWIVENEITVTFIPTLLAEVLLQLAWPEKSRLRYMLTGGDTLRSFPRHDIPFTLINNYGTAECTVVSSSGMVSPTAAPQQLPSIGREITGTQIYILDDQLRDVPAGLPGEICIAGVGLARGYLNRAELTRQKFVSREDGSRLYRTGDMGRRNPDGSIQFLGRTDEQIQVRGYRVECGEVEAALNSLPLVHNSAVIAREEVGGSRRLVAYVVPAGTALPTRDQLRDGLRRTLPEYMIPERFIRLDHLPTSDNGKIDRRKLPEATEDNIITSINEDAPMVEKELIQMLTNLLGVGEIGREDNFFFLGGHSFIAAQLIARIRDHFNVELGLRTIFDHPTPAAMAEQIQSRLVQSR